MFDPKEDANDLVDHAITKAAEVLLSTIAPGLSDQLSRIDWPDEIVITTTIRVNRRGK